MSLNTALAPDVAPPTPRAAEPHPVTRMMVGRVALGVLTLGVDSLIIFAGTEALAGNAAPAIRGHSATPAQLRALEAQLHLNRSVFAQYGSWIGGILTGHPGKSLANGLPVWCIVGPAALNSAVLVAVSGVIATIVGATLRCVAALRKDSLFDHASSVLALAVTSLPDFVVAITLIILFATVVWHVLPAVSLLAPGTYAWAHPREPILPVPTLGVVTAPFTIPMRT